jgi:hypothetical protein
MAAAPTGSDTDQLMDMPAHRAMFSGFIKATEWSCVSLAMLLGLIVPAFAMGMGWWTGLGAWFLIGLAAGFLMKLGGGWWLWLGLSTVLLLIGGAITMSVIAIA